MATITIPDGAPAFVEHRYETASSYDVLIPEPGTYELVKSHGGYTAAVPCRRVETYRVNRLFTASSVDHRMDLDEADTFRLRLYAFQIGRPSTIRDGWQITPNKALVAAS